ncbi:MAG: STAS domain-containing protein [Curvibacter sp.]|nr:MAG: STAS domain-containing protein [Curvibacter sp.]
MSTAFELPSELTIYTADSTRQALLGWLQARSEQAASPACLRGASVDEVDSAGLQVLAALANTLAEQGQVLELQQPSAHLRAGLNDLGATSWFRLVPQEMPA